MAIGRKSKNSNRLKNMHDYLHNKVEEVEKERLRDRSYNHKINLVELKKQKLALKDQLKNE